MGYQITQLTKAINVNGEMSFFMSDIATEKKIRIQQAHLECDAGKTIHENGYGIIDYNRADTPLVEIVTHPDFTSDDEVWEFLKELQRTLWYNDISDADLEKWQMRCDVNISVRKTWETMLGTKVEVKNMNSISAIKRAINYEFERQSALLTEEKSVEQETRWWDDTKKLSYTMRSKADALDYRYFPEPDILPVHIDESLISEATQSLVGSTYEKMKHYKDTYAFNKEYINGLIGHKAINQLFENLVKEWIEPKLAAKYIVGFVLKQINESQTDTAMSSFNHEQFLVFLQYVWEKKISDHQAKIVINEWLETHVSIDEIIQKHWFDAEDAWFDIGALAEQIIESNPSIVDEYKKGKVTVIGFLVGQAMKASWWKCSPQDIKIVIEEKLG